MLLISTTANAEKLQFSTGLIQQTVETLELRDLDKLSEGTTTIPYRGQYQLRISSKQGRITNIGRQLFPDLIYSGTNIPLCNYLEFAWLDHTFKISDNPFIFQDLIFENGDWNLFNQVTPDTPCSVVAEEGAYFKAIWILPGDQVLQILVPVHYDRIQLRTRAELEQEFIQELKDYRPTNHSTADIDVEMLKPTNNPEISVMQGESYILQAINNNTYYIYTDDNQWVPVCDQAFPAETIANVVNDTSGSLPATTLNLTFKLYGYETDSIRIALDEMLSYCRDKGCSCYWGLESVEESTVSGTIYIKNPTLGYSHILHLTTDIAKLIQNEGMSEARIQLFIPMNNVQNFYHKTQTHDNAIF